MFTRRHPASDSSRAAPPPINRSRRGAFIGCAIGLAGARVSTAAEESLVAFTSGGFVYVACVSLSFRAGGQTRPAV
jgi:hypothetical protein